MSTGLVRPELNGLARRISRDLRPMRLTPSEVKAKLAAYLPKNEDGNLVGIAEFKQQYLSGDPECRKQILSKLFGVQSIRQEVLKSDCFARWGGWQLS